MTPEHIIRDSGRSAVVPGPWQWMATPLQTTPLRMKPHPETGNTGLPEAGSGRLKIVEMTGQPNQVVGFKIANEPPIFWGPSLPDVRLGIAEQLAERVGSRRAYFLIRLSWTRDHLPTVRDDVAAITNLRARFPEHRHIMLCNTRSELTSYAEHNVPGIVCSTLAFVDETIFDVARTEKQFDAVYNAAIVPFKRHALCRNIRSLALIHHRFHPERMQKPGYEDEIRATLPSATIVNELEGAFRLLDIREVAGWLNRARVGLCLSEVEGAMRAAAEYLLCGLPVVSTPSVGGRHRVLDPAWSRIVEPEPEAVATAVKELIAARIDPHEIRRGAFDKLRPDRLRLIRLLAAIHKQEGALFPERAPWEKLFRIGTWPIASAAELVDGPGIADPSG